MSFVVASSRLDELLSTLGRLTVPFDELPPGLTAINPRLHGDPVLVGAVNGLSYLIDVAGTAYSETDLGAIPRGPTGVPVGTFVAALAGFVEVTVGGVVSTGTTGWFMSC